MLALHQKAARTIRPGNNERKQGNETHSYRILLGATRPMADANHGHVLHANPEYLELLEMTPALSPNSPHVDKLTSGQMKKWSSANRGNSDLAM